MKEKKMECSHCDFKTSQVSNLKKHITNIHMDKKPFFICDTCNKSFTTKCGFEIHIASVHKGSKPFACPICDSTVAIKSNLKKNNEAVHEKKK